MNELNECFPTKQLMFVVGDAASQNFHLAATSDQETYFLHVSDVSKLQVASKLGCLTTKGPEVA